MMKSILLLGCLFAVHAQASIPPATFIVNQVLKSHESIKTLALEGRVTDVRTNQIFKEILKVDFETGRLSLAYLGANDEPLGGVETKLREVHRLGKFWMGVALDPNGSRFRQALQELNALPNDKTVAKLSRIGTQVTWSWGEENEIQFLKDEFLAFDYRSGGEGPNGQELLLKDYASSAVRVPRNVFLKLQGKEVYRYELKGMKTNTVLKYPPTVTAINQPSVKEWTMLVR